MKKSKKGRVGRPAKFTVKGARAIRLEVKWGGTYKHVADRYGVSIGTIAQIVNRQGAYSL